MTRVDRMVVRIGPQDLGKLQGLPASLRITAMLLSRLHKGRLDLVLPDGRTLRFEGDEPGPRGEIIVNDISFAKRVLARGDIGFAEVYMDGKVDSPAMADVLEYFTCNFEAAGKLAVGGRLARLYFAIRHALRSNTKRGSKRNILAHYDLGNDFYAAWLDRTMTYSSALFESPDQDLSEAQLNKYRSVARHLQLQPGDHVMEIGSGWGGFAEVAAGEFGARVTGVTISNAQHDFATVRLAGAGLSDRADILLSDYRDIEGQYDAVASIEMFEAVGEEYWPAYFDKIASVLKPGGRAALQIITIDDAHFEDYRSRADFIQTYIFPGGMLPSITRLQEESTRAGLGFEIGGLFGHDYARTLGLWAERFGGAWDRIKSGQFDERFRRLWLYYFAYCEAGFRTGRVNVGQFVLTKPV